MCSTYTISTRCRMDIMPVHLMVLMARMGHTLIRPTLQAPVLLEGDARMMRWGLWRWGEKSITNIPAGEMATPLWLAALETGPCLIPLTGFYEFREPPHKSRDRLYLTPENTDEDWLWAAGIWEHHGHLGDCFAMLRRKSAPGEIPVKGSRPVLVNRHQRTGFLMGKFPHLDFNPVRLSAQRPEKIGNAGTPHQL